MIANETTLHQRTNEVEVLSQKYRSEINETFPK